eukprot:1147974-Pelagomonas_calceolata.AAC.3
MGTWRVIRHAPGSPDSPSPQESRLLSTAPCPDSPPPQESRLLSTAPCPATSPPDFPLNFKSECLICCD